MTLPPWRQGNKQYHFMEEAKKSKVIIGEESKKGIEQAWCTEYNAQINVLGRLEKDRNIGYIPKHIQQNGQFADCAGIMSTEQLLGQRIRQRTERAGTLIRRMIAQYDQYDTGYITRDQFDLFLKTWNIRLEPPELQLLMEKYSANRQGEDSMRIKDFLKCAIPEKFQ